MLLNNFGLHSLIALVILTSSYIFWKSYQNMPVSKCFIFFDIDGTLTKFSGDHPKGLYNLWCLYGPDCFKRKDDILALFENTSNLKKIQKFLGDLCKLPKTEYEIVIVTNNFKQPVQTLWTDIFKCPWDRININSAFRSSSVNKIDLIQKIVKDPVNSTCKFIYYEDDTSYLFSESLPKEVKIVNCSNEWLGMKL